MKIATYNVNGIRARMDLLLEWLAKEAPDIACLQETKVTDELFPIEDLAKAGYQSVFAGEKGFNGVAIVSRTKPDDVITGFKHSTPKDGPRFIRARFGDFWVLNTYIPQGQDVQKEQFQYKLKWFSRFLKEIETDYSPSDAMVWVGDLNVALTDKDVHSPEKMAGSVGFHPKEQALLRKCEKLGFTDVFRHFHPDDIAYTFWDYRVPNGLARDVGWRLDYIYATAPILQKMKHCDVEKNLRAAPKPSDHAPVVAVFS